MRSHEVDYEILGDDMQMVEVELDEDAAPLLRADTKFWVVKPRLSAAEISELSSAVPEPSSVALLSILGLGLAGYRRRRS